MWDLNYTEDWELRNRCFLIVVLEETLENHLDCKEIKPVNRKGNQSWKFIGRIVADAETQIIWLTDAKSWLIKKDPVVGKDWRQKENEVKEDEIVRHHQWLNGHEFEKIPGDSEGQSSLLCCSPWGWEELEMTYQLNSNKVSHRFYTRV